jgi:hypothetical protein
MFDYDVAKEVYPGFNAVWSTADRI